RVASGSPACAEARPTWYRRRRGRSGSPLGRPRSQRAPSQSRGAASAAASASMPLAVAATMRRAAEVSSSSPSHSSPARAGPRRAARERGELSRPRPRRIISIIATIESGQASAQRPRKIVDISLTCWEGVARGDMCRRTAGGDDDLLVRLEDECCRVAGLRLPVHPPVKAAAVAAEAAGVEADAPLAKQLAERVRAVLCRLDVNHPVRLMGVDLGDERVAVDADPGRQRNMAAVHVGVDVLMDVKRELLLRQRVEMHVAQPLLHGGAPLCNPDIAAKSTRTGFAELPLERIAATATPTATSATNAAPPVHQRLSSGCRLPTGGGAARRCARTRFPLLTCCLLLPRSHDHHGPDMREPPLRSAATQKRKRCSTAGEARPSERAGARTISTETNASTSATHQSAAGGGATVENEPSVRSSACTGCELAQTAHVVPTAAIHMNCSS